MGRDEEARRAGVQSRSGGSMRFQIIEAEQRSEEWFAARAGRATGSRAADILAKIKSGEAAARRDYRVQLAVERIIGRPQEDGYVSKDMQRGIDREPAMVAAYEAYSGNIVRQTGFLSMVDCPAGCSLDGDIDNFNGILEGKCPKSATHVEYLRRNRVPPEYVPQCTHDLWVSGAEYVDFVSFDDRMPEGLQFLCVRAFRDEFDIAAYERALRAFLAEVEEEVAALKRLRSAA